MYASMKITELMYDVSELMLNLGPGNTMKTMQRVLFDMAAPKEAADDGETQSVENAFRRPKRRKARLSRRSGAARAALAAPARRARPRHRKEGAEGVESAGMFLDGAVSNEAGKRSYKLYVPSGYRGQPLPLVVMLHGCKQDPDDFALGTRMNLVAEEECCFVLYPAQARSASRPKCWNWFEARNQRRGQGEPSLIADMTREVMRNYRIDARRVYVAGLSAGGAMAAIMALAYPELYAAAAVHSGVACHAADNLYAALMAMKHGPRESGGGAIADRAVPMIVFHGDADTVVHPSNGDFVVRQAVGMPEAAASSITRGELPEGRSYTRTVHRDRDGQLLAEQWLIHGSGHAWSGGSGDGSHTDPLGPDATREMMRFFAAQAKPDGAPAAADPSAAELSPL